MNPRFNECELTDIARTPIDMGLACAQHLQYEQALHGLGVQVHELPAEADLPDSVFVQDTALVLDKIAVITRPGAAPRRAKTDFIERALSP